MRSSTRPRGISSRLRAIRWTGRLSRRRLLRGEDGAFVNFEGVARNNTKGRPTRYLDYECYEPMAVKMMAQIGGEIAASFAIGRIAMVHRLGRIEIGRNQRRRGGHGAAPQAGVRGRA